MATAEFATSAQTGWNFDNSYLKLPDMFYQRQAPVAVRDPQLTLFNHLLAEQLGLKSQELNTSRGAEIFAGNLLPPGAVPLAQAYAGHQFGGFTMLGDGRALLLGEQITPAGERVDIQLKGSGQTPFSRRGDGRAALGPMLREYLISEAMHALGIPTNRSLAVVTTGESVRRDTLLPGAVLTRVAASHLRVGTFEYAAWRGTRDDVKILADYCIHRHYPEAAAQDNPYLALLEAVIDRQAALVAGWLLIGFIHGVMNTDNVSIAGETIDYGPCAFMDAYNPATVFSSIDHQGRYAYANQPPITQWNLTRFAETLLPLLAEQQKTAVAMAQQALDQFESRFRRYWLPGMRGKLGLLDEQEQDVALIDDLLAIMQRLRADYTNSFRDLADEQLTHSELHQDAAFQEWHKRWRERLAQQGQPLRTVRKIMDRHNPAVIPRNHRVEGALTAAEQDGNLQPFEHLLRILATPYADLADADRDYREPPEPSNRIYQTFCGT
ncbi:protein adenylyltransferase SelO [Pelovirga terrestris]|uniref:Protein nucleotidyltransferase YdiU n=1 Tax=Pelovirga terrestris TaxID=2771352 RepID=A0A8J6R5V8_9BACT|nr:YdiU family protein [Pelovirga terrestris]MBD1400689.1 YdiU family protein [Pelovirga terrestris]